MLRRISGNRIPIPWRAPLLRRIAIAVGLLLAAAPLAGCARNSSRPPAEPAALQHPTPIAPITNTDPCATRLHDICGGLLLYYATKHRLPPRLDDMRTLPGMAQVAQFACPVSGKPYLYNPVGVSSPQQKARVILYDPAPSHSGMRWAISIVEPEDGGALVAKVIALPESHFAFQGPK